MKKEYDFEYIVELLQAQYAQQQKESQAQYARHEENYNLLFEQNNSLFEQNSLLFKQNEVLNAKLDRIEQHVIVIKNVALSQFQGITKTSKEAIQTSAELALENKEEILHDTLIWTPSNPEYHEVESPAKRTAISKFKLTNVINGYNPPQESGLYLAQEKLIPQKAYVSSCGNWLNSVLNQMFQTPFRGKYPLLTHDLIEALTSFWVVERSAHGRMY